MIDFAFELIGCQFSAKRKWKFLVSKNAKKPNENVVFDSSCQMPNDKGMLNNTVDNNFKVGLLYLGIN